MRKVFLEKLNKTWKGIDWTNSYGLIVNFEYDDIKGELEILDKIPNSDKLNVKYNDNTYTIQTDSLLHGRIGFIVGKNTNDFKYNIGCIIENTYGKIKIINTKLIKKNSQSGYYKYYDFECINCGYKGELYESNIVKGYGCPICSKNKRQLEKRKSKYIEVKNYIESLGLELLSKEYINNHKNLTVKCKCGNIFERALSTFKGTPKREGVTVCPSCNGVTINTYESVKEDLLNHNIELLETEYINQNTNMKIKYINCGFEVERNYANIIKSKYKCPHCIKSGYGRDTEQLKQEIFDITNGEYELLSEYKTMNDKVLIKHNKCGNKYNITPHNFLDSGNRCPKCGQSKGETKIDELLTKLNIKHIPQYTYSNLLSKYGNPLRFDFAVMNNNKVSFLIEYDGEFHYKKIHRYHDLKGQQERDKLKDCYCKENNIDLLRIPYWDFDNIEEIIKNKLKEKNLI